MHTYQRQYKSNQNLTLKVKHNLIIFLLFKMIVPSLPYVLIYSAMTESPDTRGVMIFGGFTSENFMEIHDTNCGD